MKMLNLYIPNTNIKVSGTLWEWEVKIWVGNLAECFEKLKMIYYNELGKNISFEAEFWPKGPPDPLIPEPYDCFSSISDLYQKDPELESEPLFHKRVRGSGSRSKQNGSKTLFKERAFINSVSGLQMAG